MIFKAFMIILGVAIAIATISQIVCNIINNKYIEKHDN